MKNILIIIAGFLAHSAFSQIDTVNNGSYPGSGDGETLYTAFQKVNEAIHFLNDSIITISDTAKYSDTSGFAEDYDRRHDLLINRNNAGQHDQSAITDLTDTIASHRTDIELRAYQSALEDTAADIRSDMSSSFTQPIDSLLLNPNIPTQSANDFKIFADSATGLIGIFNEGQPGNTYINATQSTPFYNTTTDTLLPGTAVSGDTAYIQGIRVYVSIQKTDRRYKSLCQRFVGVCRDTVFPNTVGIVNRFNIQSLSTAAWSLKDRIYVDTAGLLTNIEPMPPDYVCFVGLVTRTNLLAVNATPFSGSDTDVNIQGLINGIIVQKQGLFDTIISNTLYFDTYNEEYPQRNLPFIADNIRYDLNTLTGSGKSGWARIALVWGTVDNPTLNNIYIDVNGGNPVLSVTSSNFPADGIKVATAYVADENYHTDSSFISFQRYNNSIDGSVSAGWISRSGERIRKEGSKYQKPGLDPTVYIGTNGAGIDTLKVSHNSGLAYQFNLQTIPANDGGGYLLVNDPNSPNGIRVINDLSEIDVDANGNTLRDNNTRYGLNLFINVSSGDYGGKILVTTPQNSYSTNQNAIDDVSGYAITNVPNMFEQTAIRWCRVVVNYSTASGGTITNLLGAGGYQDERGFVLGTSGGSGTSGAAKNEYSTSEFKLYDPSDPTKYTDFDNSNQSTGTTRTIIMADEDVDLSKRIDSAGVSTPKQVPVYVTPNTIQGTSTLTVDGDSVISEKHRVTDTLYLDNGILLPDGTFIDTNYFGYTIVDTTVYISEANGDDNAAGTELAPFATLNKALETLPKKNKDNIGSIICDTGTYNFTNSDRELIREFNLNNAQLLVQADNLTIQTSGFTLSTTSELLKYDVSFPGNTWTLNEYQDMFIEQGGEYFPITANTAGTDNMTIEFTDHAEAGATDIYDLNVTFVNSDASETFMEYNTNGSVNGDIQFNYIEFDAGATLQDIYDTDVENTYYGCRVLANQLDIAAGGINFESCVILGNGGSAGLVYNNTAPSLNRYFQTYARCATSNPVVGHKRSDADYTDFVCDGAGGFRSTEGQPSARRVLKIVDATSAINNNNKAGSIIGNQGSTLMLYGVTNIFNVSNRFNTQYTFDNFYSDGYTSIFASGTDSIFVKPEWNTIIDIPTLGTEVDIDSMRVQKMYGDSIIVDSSLHVIGKFKVNDTSSVFYTQVYTEVDTLPSSGAITIDCNKSNIFVCYQTGNITGLDIENMQPGGTYVANFYQGVTGGYTITLSLTPDNYEASGHEDFSTTANDKNKFQFQSDDGVSIDYSNHVFTKQ